MSRLPTTAVWRILPVGTPALLKRCPRCDQVRPFVSSDKFRINAQGRRIDVWLVYRCSYCDHTYNREVLSRVSPESIPPDRYAGYLANDPSLAQQVAFSTRSGPTAPMERFDVNVGGPATGRARLVVPLPISVRLDRVLSAALHLSRKEAREALKSGHIRVEGFDPKPSSSVRDGWIIRFPKRVPANSGC